LTLIEDLRTRTNKLKLEIHALYLAARDHRTPWYAKAFIACVVAYALSPIDLIPDPIPILGYVDDLLLLPLGIYLALKMIPQPILAECRHKASLANEQLPENWWVASVILLLWVTALILLGNFLLQSIGR
jgi:uncharacterized membrane protein YkvA (DUF1232 family)